jgi:hypothetical protein
MKILESRLLWGCLLIVGGILLLLENLGIVAIGGLFWALLLGLGGIFFLWIFIQNRRNWWALIPFFTLWGIAALIVLEERAPSLADIWGASLVLGSIGLSFWAIYLNDRQNWWAIIPGGVLLTLASVAGLGRALDLLQVGGIFFIGLGLTFALVALLPSPQSELRWAWVPAGILLVMGALLLATLGNMLNIIWPAALILLGGFMILRSLIKR